MAQALNSVTGALAVNELGKTLMHEHILIGVPGWETDTGGPRHARKDLIASISDRLLETKDAGYSSMLDPCPSDMGRDVELMAEISSRSGFNIVCATGLYTEENGATSYWNLKRRFTTDAVAQLTDVMIAEIEDGIADTGIKAGVIKLASGSGPMTDYERFVFTAGARASVATGTPITTHTQGTTGTEQLEFLKNLGVPAHQVIIGHCCASDDRHYHKELMDAGCYLGFDQFGLDFGESRDPLRMASLLALYKAGGLRQLIVSHDLVFCQLGRMFPPDIEKKQNSMDPLHFVKNIAPKLREAGMTSEDFDMIFEENPRRYFSGEELG